MGKYLVVVESPTKARTISNILGKSYDVAFSMGHIVDLPTRALSIDIEKGFVATFRIIPGKEKILKLLKKKAQGKDIIYIATDPDREGEAIGWHIKNLLSKNNKRFNRVIFHEITESAIMEAFRSAGVLDMNKVNAQKVRRILDRIVGYYLSPLLWKKVLRGLSAGRVQSVALKFIVEKESAIKRFIPEKTFEVEAVFKVGDESFKARLKSFNNKKAVYQTKEEANKILRDLKEEQFFVKDITKRKVMRKPPSPFSTSLLQQDAFNKLRFSSKKTMLIAQRLYEGVDIANQMLGLITYMRTDSFYIADKAKKDAKSFIEKKFSKFYVCEKDYKYKEKKSAQLAHEAIRPTVTERTPLSIKDYLKSDEYKLYDLIWKRFVASFMREAVFEYTHVVIGNDNAIFVSESKKIVFDGFLKVLGKEAEKILPSLDKGKNLLLENLEVVEKTTKPPPRFSDASLVKLLEDKGIGRPSTYAPTISTLIMRNYIKREKGQFIPTDLGVKVCELLVKYFPDIMDETFTAQVEEKLDGIEEGKIEGQKVLEEFYPSFKAKVDEASKLIKKHIELVDKRCPKCERQLMVKWSKKGKFLSCTGFPYCKYAESITTGITCPECKKGELIERRNKKGQFFYGCSTFPKCCYTTRSLPKDSSEHR